MAKKDKKQEEKSEEQMAHEIALRTDLEMTLNNHRANDLLTVMDDGEVDGMPQIDRILSVIRKMEIEIEDIQEQVKTYVEYNQILINKKEQQIMYFVNVMKNWMFEQGDKKTVKGVNGTLSKRKTTKYDYKDEDGILQWCKDNEVSAIKTEEKIDKNKLKTYIKDTGDAPDEEMLKVYEEESFNVKTNKEQES